MEETIYVLRYETRVSITYNAPVARIKPKQNTGGWSNGAGINAAWLFLALIVYTGLSISINVCASPCLAAR